jgi:hypothetical protein
MCNSIWSSSLVRLVASRSCFDVWKEWVFGVVNLLSDLANTSQVLGNMLILEELQYDKGTLNVQSLALYR